MQTGADSRQSVQFRDAWQRSRWHKGKFRPSLRGPKLNGLDPELYLRQVLTSIPEHPISRIDELLPWKIVLADTPASNFTS